MVFEKWRETSRSERHLMLSKALMLAKSRLERAQERRERKRRQLARIIGDMEVWDNPLKLSQIIDKWQEGEAKSYKGRNPVDL